MPLPTKFRVLGAVHLGLLSVAAAAIGPDGAPPDESRIDHSEQTALIKMAALQRLRNGFAKQLPPPGPGQRRLSIFVDVQRESFHLEQVTVRIDQRDPLIHKYDETQAMALLEGTAHRIARANLDRGEHKVRIAYSGHERGVDYVGNRISDSVELTLDAGSRDRVFFVGINPRALQYGLFGGSPAQIREVGEASADPRLELVRLLRKQEQYFAAARELLEIAGPTDDPAPLPEGYHALIAHTYLDYGMHSQALEAVQRASGKAHWQPTLDAAWLRIAELGYRRGELQQTLQILDSMRPFLKLNRDDRLIWQDLKSRVLLALDRYSQAAEVLKSANHTIDHSVSHDWSFERSMHLRYNYAIALIGDGRLAQGRSLLDRLGTEKEMQGYAAHMQQKANLTLAYHFLREGQAATAKPIFQRLPLDSPYTNSALLGLGWSELSEPGTRQEQASPQAFRSVWYPGRFEVAPLPEGDEDKFKRALVPWRELVQRQPFDFAVLEALAAVPYAVERLDRTDAAFTGYQRAQAIYEHTYNALKSKQDALRHGLLTAAILGQATDPVLDTHLLQRARASRRIHQHLQDYRDLQFLEGALLRENLAGGLDPLLYAMAFAAAGEAQAAQKLLADEIDTYLAEIERLELAARYGLARHYDRQLKEAGAVGRTPLDRGASEIPSQSE